MSDLIRDTTDDLSARIGGDDPLFSDQGGSDGLQRDSQELEKVITLLGEHAATVLSTVLNRAISFDPLPPETVDPTALPTKVEQPMLVVRMGLEGEDGVGGAMFLLIPRTDVAVLADLMMMGDGTAEYTDDHRDALAELVNQILGSYLKALREEIGHTVSCAIPEVGDGAPDGADPEWTDGVISFLSVSIAGSRSTVMGLVLDRRIARSLAGAIRDREQTGGAVDEGGIGLSAAELDELSRVASDGGAEGGFFEETGTGGQRKTQPQGVDMLLDIELDVSIELGRSNLSIKRILDLAPGSIIELDKMAGEPVDLLVNGKVVAKGEVVVVDENFGVRIVSLVSAEDRIRSLH